MNKKGRGKRREKMSSQILLQQLQLTAASTVAAASSKGRSVLHMCRNWNDFIDHKQMKFALPTSPATGSVDLNMLYNRWIVNMKAFKYNYLVASLLPLTLAMLWWWSIILASVVSLAIFFAVHVADTLTGRQFQKIGSHVVTRFDKNVAASLLSLITFYLLSALTKVLISLLLSLLLSSLHALLRYRPPALSQKARNIEEESEARKTANAVEEGVRIMEEDVNVGEGGVRSRVGGGGGMGGRGGGGPVPGHFVGGNRNKAE
ncbi:hypothetical protein TrCOL_g2881 [Triparma columacea]|uniref:PRA1 family protein n=1 Tax=Triparma columacea TaxID=722753 RepID=A0A9W7GFD4_9STRA|nr:hypothetical protein TrCOL_g2881 [Triparma columacea]